MYNHCCYIMNYYIYYIIIIYMCVKSGILCHLQRVVDVGGQDGQEVINATDEERSCRTNQKEPLIGVGVTYCISYFNLIYFTFNLRRDAVLGPVSGENHCNQVSPGGVATEVQTSEASANKVSISE